MGGGGVLGGHKEGKKTLCASAQMHAHNLVVNSYSDPQISQSGGKTSRVHATTPRFSI